MTSSETHPADIGLIGLAVMGANLALNMESRGLTVAVYNRSAAKTREFIDGPAAGRRFIGCDSLGALVAALSPPRRIMLMVKAGAPVDKTIAALLPLLNPGDILIDGGNSHFEDTERRAQQVEGQGLHYIGTGVSGGEEGALKGPSMMPGGSRDAWEAIRPVFEAVAARAEDGQPCCAWIGSGGAGHFVKMVHNGIEYGDMQLIAESYHLMRAMAELSGEDTRKVFARWNEGPLQSYLIEITARILAYREADGTLLVDRILDSAGQKGTGRWTVSAALDLGVPLTLIGESVFARFLSAAKDERVRTAAQLKGPATAFAGDRQALVDDLEQALLASKIVSYAQGFALMRAAAREYGWQLDNSAIARVWRAGCIIRSVFLDTIAEAYRDTPELENLLLAPYFQNTIHAAQAGWRRVVATAVQQGVAIPALAGALTYYDGLRAAWLPANLLQAQRDFFGAHTYERVDRPQGEFQHTEWLQPPTATA
jgi:6-phosphogluconate dehydrogenase